MTTVAHPTGDCSICLNSLSEGRQTAKKTSCSHVFHEDCIAGWVSNHSTCPYCRASL
ncbi:hypothetical protein REPUB_Repub20aG0025100 [Reevesia pubescens]